MRLSMRGLLPLTIFLFTVAISAQADAATTIVPQGGNENWGTTLWSKANSPYIVDGEISVRFGSLTIEPGTVVKFTVGSSIVFHGDVGIDIAGTADEPVYFTSFRDDSVGGDTNEDGDATMPAPGDWGYLAFGGSTNHGDFGFSHFKLRYGGGAAFSTSRYGTIFPALVLRYPRFGTIPGRQYSVETIEVSHSGGEGMYVFIDSQHTLTLASSGLYENSDVALLRDGPNTFSGNNISGAINAANNWWGDASGPYHPTSNPEGLGDEVDTSVTGFGGAITYEPWLTENPWPDSLPTPSEPETPDPVIIIPGILGSEQHNGEWVIDPILHTYDDLIATLDANGYTPEVDLFPFPYNWRQSNVDTAIELKAKIDEIKTICACDKVDIVAHSMGGLVARQYIQSDAYEDDVDQLIFLGTPHLGAPKAYLMWEGGTMGDDWQDAPLNFILTQEAKEYGYPDLFSYIRDEPIPAVGELLPVYDYIFDAAQLRAYPTGYPTNPFLEGLNANLDKLINSGVEVFSIRGELNEAGTIVGITALDPVSHLPKWEHGFPELVLGSGDGTVPTASASFVNSNLLTKVSSHRRLPTIAASDVYELLTGEVPVTLIDNPDLINFKLILFKILSPADLLVVAPDGKKIGRDFSGQDINEIPEAFYTGVNTDTEFITILNPLDGEYKIYTQGTDVGSYTVETAFIDEEQVVEKSFTGNTTPQQITELNFSLNNDNPEESEILPADVEPPVITITQPQHKDYLRSEMLPVEVSAVDADSGVQLLETYFHGTLIQNADTIDLFLHSLGTHTILATSTDNVGNATSTSREFRVIATHESTLSDLERARELGWVNELAYTVLSSQMMGIFRAASNSPAVVAPSLYRAILNQLDQRRGKGLNEQGHKLLKENIEWFITN